MWESASITRTGRSVSSVVIATSHSLRRYPVKRGFTPTALGAGPVVVVGRLGRRNVGADRRIRWRHGRLDGGVHIAPAALADHHQAWSDRPRSVCYPDRIGS